MMRTWIVFIALILCAGIAAWFRIEDQDQVELQRAAPLRESDLEAQVRSSPVPLPSVEQKVFLKKEDESELAAYLNQNYPGPWNLQKDESQKIITLLGGEIPGAGVSPESATELARKIAPFLGVTSDEVVASGVKMDSTPRSVTYDFKQKFQGYEVFEGQMRFFARKEDGSVFMINSELHPVRDLNPEIVYQAEDARREVEDRYSSRGAISIEQKSSRPVIWAEGSSAELAWFFIVSIQGESLDRLQVLVSVQSNRIILERSLLVSGFIQFEFF